MVKTSVILVNTDTSKDTSKHNFAQIIHSLCPFKLSMGTSTLWLFLGILKSYEEDYSY